MAVDHEIVVIGAGLAGLSAARALSDGGRDVLVLDKGRQIGGRIAHRDRGEYGFDHGCPWVEPDGGAFAECMARAVASGHAARVRGAPARIVGVPGAGGLLAPLADGLEIRQLVEVSRARREGDVWTLETAAGGTSARHLVSTVPAPQAARLFPAFASEIDRAEMLPCWTLMAAFATPLAVPAPEWPDNGARVIREADKPGRAGGLDAWTMHAPVGWSAENMERDREEIVPDLLRMLSRALERQLPEPVHARAHRWRFARSGQTLGRAFLEGEALHVGGDWCLGPSAADAFESGRGIAEAILGRQQARKAG